MKKKLKNILLTSIFLFLSFFISISLTSCGVFQFPKEFTIGNSNDLFGNSKVPLGSSFSDSPSTTNFNSVFSRWVNYFTSFDDKNSDYIYSDGSWNKPTTSLKMELASKIEIDYIDNSIAPITKQEQKVTLDNLNPSNEFFVERMTSDGQKKITNEIDVKKLSQYLTKATKISFVINDKFKWIDKNGSEQQNLSVKDFYFGLIAYKLSVDIGFNRNGYFIDLSGIDYGKTLEENKAIKESIDKNIETSINKFTFVLGNTKPPYFLDLLTKQYFFPIPNTHPDASFIKSYITNPNGFYNDVNNPLKFDKETKKFISANTDWTRVYGGDQKNNLDVWSVGPYYVSNISLQDVSFKLNKNYFYALNENSEEKINQSEKIQKIVLKYKAGTPDVMYNRFKSGEMSYVLVPPSQNDDAISKFYFDWNKQEFEGQKKPLVAIPASKTIQSNYISYNQAIYKQSSSEYAELKDNSLLNWKNFIDNFNTEDGLNIRKGINTLLNWARLAEKKFGPGIKDINMSSIPYGVYEIEEEVGKYVEYYQEIKSKSNEFKGIIDGKYNAMSIQDGYVMNDAETKEKMISSLTKLGYTQENPLKFTFWTLSQANDPKDIAYFSQLETVFKDVFVAKGNSNPLVVFEFIPFNQNSINKVFNEKSITSGSFMWGPDYNGLGTWVGLYFAFDYNSNGTPKKSKIQTIDSNDNKIDKDILFPAYHIANLWEMMFEDLDSVDDSNNSSDSDDIIFKKSLKKHLKETNAAKFNEKDTTDKKVSFVDIKSNLDTEISIWAGSVTNKSDFVTGDTSKTLMDNGKWLIQWIDSKYPVIPSAMPGLNYQSFKLVDPNYIVVLNQNGEMNYRDFWHLNSN